MNECCKLPPDSICAQCGVHLDPWISWVFDIDHYYCIDHAPSEVSSAALEYSRLRAQTCLKYLDKLLATPLEDVELLREYTSKAGVAIVESPSPHMWQWGELAGVLTALCLRYQYIRLTAQGHRLHRFMATRTRVLR